MKRVPNVAQRVLMAVLGAPVLVLVQCQAITPAPTPSVASPLPTAAATSPATAATPESPTPEQMPTTTAAATLAVAAAPSITSAPPASPTVAAATETPVPPATERATRGAVLEVQEYEVPRGSHPHDVAPAADGGVWYTAQSGAALGWLDVETGDTEHIPLGSGSSPHGVIVGPDEAAWITDSGLNAIVRVDAQSREVTRFDLPADAARANLNTAVFDSTGKLWFTGQNGFYGVLDPATSQTEVYPAPKGRGPYGITTTPDGKVYYASLAGSYVGEIDPATGEVTVLEPPTTDQGARRVWSDSRGLVWVSEWNAGQLGRYDPASGTWMEWRLPGDQPRAYSVYVDWQDQVWLSDFGSNTLVRFDPMTETFESVPLPSPNASVRQMHGRPGEIWGAESGADKLVVVRVR